MSRTKTESLTLILLAALALTVRVFHLDFLGFWMDEGFTIQYGIQSVAGIFRLSFSVEPNPPLYPLVIHFWQLIFGDSEFALRLPSALAGSSCVVMIYLIGVRAGLMRTALIASLIATFSPPQIAYSQEARSYVFAALLGLISIYYIPQEQGWQSSKRKYLYAIATIAMLYTHAYSVFLLAAENCVLFISWRLQSTPNPKFKNWLKIQALVIFAAAPWYATIPSNSLRLHYIDWLKDYSFPSAPELISYFVGSDSSAIGWLIILAFLCIWLTPIVLARKNPRRKSEFLSNQDLFILLLWSVFTFVLPLIVSEVWRPVFVKRYALGAGLAFYLWGLAPLEGWLKRSRITFIICIAITAAYGTNACFKYYGSNKKVEWREVIRYVAACDKGSIILIAPTHSYFGNVPGYYQRKIDGHERIQILYSNEPASMKSLILSSGHGWVVTEKQIPDQNSAPLLIAGLRLKKHLDFYGLSLDLFGSDSLDATSCTK